MNFTLELEKIANDKKSGSAAIVKDVQNAIYLYCTIEKDIDKYLLINSLNKLFARNGQFAALYHFMNILFNWIELFFNNDIKISSNKINSFLEDYNFKWEKANKEIAVHFHSFLNETKFSKVLIHSNSSTISDTLRILSLKENVELFQTISSPQEEGKLQAEYLNSVGYKVNFIVDALVAKIIKEVDFCLLGADVIFENYFLNKSGSMAIALLAKHYNKPVYVLTDTRKFLANEIGLEFQLEFTKAKDEVWANAPEGIVPLNYYYDHIENKLISLFFTENKQYDSNHIKNLIKKQAHSKYFE